MSDTERLLRVHVHIAGRVQGVGFRYATADEARRLGLAGWVRNLDRGGQVEAVFEGRRAAVEEMLRWCAAGPPGAFVREVRVDWDEPLENLARFEIRATAFN
jgi:acylphosphatase